MIAWPGNNHAKQAQYCLILLSSSSLSLYKNHLSRLKYIESKASVRKMCTLFCIDLLKKSFILNIIVFFIFFLGLHAVKFA